MTHSLGVPTRNQLTLIWNERARQEQLKAEGRFDHTPADPELNDYERLAILAEEFGEVARAVLEASRPLPGDDVLPGIYELSFREVLRAELTQVAAVCVAWLEAIDARGHA